MGMRIWELHALGLGGAIRSTPAGEADIAGLLLSEKAYLLAVRDFRPAELVRLVEDQGAIAAALPLVAHYRDGEALRAAGGRGLAAVRGHGPGPLLKRSDEVRIPVAAGESSHPET